MQKTGIIALSVAVATALLPISAAFAQDLTSVRFNLGWRVEASAAGFLLAEQNGWYEEEGVDITIDVGNGSAGAVNAVAGGAYEAASADIAAMIEHNVNNPDRPLIAAAIQYDSNPNSILVRADSEIVEPADLAGKAIIGQPFNASRKLFPIFAEDVGIDPGSVEWQNVDPQLGYQMFARGEHDAVAFFFFTGLMNLEPVGMTADEVRVFRFSEYGMESYGNAIVIDPEFAAENPEAMAGFVRASVRGWVAAIEDPAAAAAAVKARDELTDEALELRRLEMIIDGTMRTEDTLANGWGAATPDRIQATIDEVVAAFGLEAELSPEEVFTDAYLPPMDVRAIN